MCDVIPANDTLNNIYIITICIIIISIFQVQIQNTSGQKVETRSDIQKLFAKYDVVETSYHVYCGRIDLHLCEDANPDTRKQLNYSLWHEFPMSHIERVLFTYHSF